MTLSWGTDAIARVVYAHERVKYRWSSGWLSYDYLKANAFVESSAHTLGHGGEGTHCSGRRDSTVESLA